VSLLVLVVAVLIAHAPFARKRARVWISGGSVFVVVGLLEQNSRSYGYEADGFHRAGVEFLVLVGIIVVGTAVAAFLCRLVPRDAP
jgi:hypothetical protein